ncbi:MAG: hypothetical protein FJY37_13630 [Betaproteobacteria bacterium]|nr:hypothetical protein [Betaproteobacteria bacterium]
MCPCAPEHKYVACCGRYHAGEVAPSAEALMRSRYSAYVLGLEDYLLASWHPETRPGLIEQGDGATRRWLGLTIKTCSATDAQHATVEFIARVRIGGRAIRLHETSRFVQEDGRWYYVDGDIHED